MGANADVQIADSGPSPRSFTVAGPGNGGSCASNNGDAIVRCVGATYPDKTAAGVSLDQRIANMEFIRDRVIEAGICGGLDLAWNKKRGTGPHSVDAIAWRHNGIDDVVDLGSAYDDTSRPLGLQWAIVAGPPGYTRIRVRRADRTREKTKPEPILRPRLFVFDLRVNQKR